MGFWTQRNRWTGREVYSCEAGLDGCKGYPCRAHKCPFGWCQRYYICQSCWQDAGIKLKFTKVAHETCRQSQAAWAVRNVQRSTMLASGAYLRCSAMSTADDRVHVLFQDQHGQTIGRYMSKQTYHVYPILENRTPEDYAMMGEVVEAPPTFVDGNKTAGQHRRA